MKIIGQLVDVHKRAIYPASIHIENNRITEVRQLESAPDRYIMPGFIDAHVHVESSMLVPSEFARLAVMHGTVATVSDPHEIANVLGIQGVQFMLDNGQQVPFKFFFGAPSCVPATSFETAGATIGIDEVTRLLDRPDIWYLSEMMNYPGVLNQDPEVMAKIKAAHDRGKPVDGHAPGLTGESAVRYIRAGISTDHECFTEEEARNKLENGMKVAIREGSAAKNYHALKSLIDVYPDRIMFCSDDKHPDDLMIGHINQLVSRAIADGFNLFNVLRAATVNPIVHYGLPVGTLQEGDPADFIVVRDLESFDVLQNYINGELVMSDGQATFPNIDIEPVNRFSASKISPSDLILKASGPKAHIIEAIDGELITRDRIIGVSQNDRNIESIHCRDIAKLVVLNRYNNTKPQMALIHGFGLKHGAIASCVAHDSHNIIAVGMNDTDLARAINLVVDQEGGIAAVSGQKVMGLPLPVAGIMSAMDGLQVGKEYARIDKFVRMVLGSTLRAPYMTLSFMALLVIPSLKLSDKGLFDGETFQFSPLFFE